MHGLRFTLAYNVFPRFNVLSVHILIMLSFDVGFLGAACAVHRDRRPYILRLFDGNACVSSDANACEEVHITAESFAVNPLFACKVVVSQMSTAFWCFSTTCSGILVRKKAALLLTKWHLVFHAYHSVSSSSHSANGDIAIQWEWSNFDHS